MLKNAVVLVSFIHSSKTMCFPSCWLFFFFRNCSRRRGFLKAVVPFSMLTSITSSYQHADFNSNSAITDITPSTTSTSTPLMISSSKVRGNLTHSCHHEHVTTTVRISILGLPWHQLLAHTGPLGWFALLREPGFRLLQ